MKFKKVELEENHRCLLERERAHKKNGYDSRRAVQFVLSEARPLEGRILDVGTGKGRLLVELAKRAGCRVTTVDADAGEQRFARMNATVAGVSSRIRFITADAAELPFKHPSFDAVISMNALHHMDNLEGVLKELVRVLRPGGKLVLADFDAAGFRLMDRLHRKEGMVHRHVPYRWASVMAFLRGKGFKIRKVRGPHVEVLVAEGQ